MTARILKRSLASFISFSALILSTACSVESSVEGLNPSNKNLTLSVENLTVTEGDLVSNNITFKLNKVTQKPVSASYTVTVTGSATAVTDFTAISGTLNFLPGEDTKTVPLITFAEGIYEGTETVELSLAVVSGILALAAPTKIINIADSDAKPTVYFASATDSVNETDADFTKTVTVSLSGPTQANVTVNVAHTANTATSAIDYVFTNQTVTILAGNTSETFDITIKGDVLVELAENFSYTLSTPSSNATIGTTATQTLTINDNDQTAFMWTGATGDGKWSTAGNWYGLAVPGAADLAIFNILCTNVAGRCTVSVDASASVAGIAMNTGYTGTITQAAAQTITVGASGWSLVAGTFVGSSAAVVINGNYSQSGGSASFAGNLTFNDSNISVTAGTFTTTAGTLLVENNTVANKTVTFTNPVTINSLSIIAETAGYVFSGTFNVGNGLSGGDLTLYSEVGPTISGGTFNINKNLTVSTVGYTNYTGMTVNLVGTATQTVSQSTCPFDVICWFPTIVINSTSDVTFSGTIPLAGNLTYVTADSVTTTGASFISVGGAKTINAPTLTFPSLSIQNTGLLQFTGTHNITNLDIQCYSFPLVGCSAQTFDVQGSLNVTGNINYYATDISVATPATSYLNLSLSGTSAQNLRGELNPGGNITINKSSETVTLVGSDFDLSMGAAGANGNLTMTDGDIDMGGYDLTVPGTLSMVAGTTIQKRCDVLTVAGAPVSPGAYGPGLILGDTALPNITISNATETAGSGADNTFLEGNAGSYNFIHTVTLSGYYCAANFTVNYASSNGTATSGSDYTSTSGTLTINSGLLTGTINVPVLGDTTVEGNESYTMTLSAPLAGTITTSTGTGTINNDDSSNFTWDGSTGDGKWSTAANWVGNAVPGGADAVFFAPGVCEPNCDVDIDVNASALAWGQYAGFPGTITQGATSTLDIGILGAILNGGTFIGSSAAMSSYSLFIAGANFTAGAQTITNYGSWGLTSGAMTMTGSTVVFSGTTAATIDIGTGQFDSITLNKNNTSLTVTGTAIVNNDLNINFVGTGFFASGTIDVKDDITITNGSSTSAAGIIDGKVRLIGTGSQDLVGATAGSNILGQLEFASSGTINLSNNIGVSKSLLHTSSGTFNPGTSVVHVWENDWAGLGLMGAATINMGTAHLYDLNINKNISTNATTTITGTLSVDNDFALDCSAGGWLSGGTIDVKGDVTGTTSWFQCFGGDAIIKMSGAVAHTLNTAVALPNLLIASSNTVNITNGSVSGNFTRTSGTIAAGTSNFRMTSILDSTPAVIAGNSTIDLGGQELNSLFINDMGSGTTTIASSLQLNADLTLGISGNLHKVNGAISVKGNIELDSLDGANSNLAITANGTGTQTIRRDVGGVWPTGAVTVNKSAGELKLLSNIDFTGAGQDLVMTLGTLNMDGYNLTVTDSLSMAATTKIYKGCGVLTVNGGAVADGAYGAGPGTIYGGDNVSISIADAGAVTEGANHTFTVTVSPLNCVDTTFNWATANGDAIGGAGGVATRDFTAQASTLATITAGSATVDLTVTTVDETPALDEPAEYYTVGLSSLMAGVTGSDVSGQGDITDDDAAPTISINDIAVSEGSNAVFRVSLSGASGQNVTFNWTTTDGTATVADSDYTAGSGTTTTITAGNTYVDLTAIATSTSTGAELSEVFTVDLSVLANATAGDLSGNATLVDSVNGIIISNLVTSAVNTIGFTATFDFTGDTDANATALLYYCNETTTPGCDPIAGTSVAMTKSGATFTATLDGLTNPGETFNIAARATDTGGVSGNDLTGSQTLSPAFFKVIHRSVGAANTNVLACGTSNGGCIGQGNLTIAGSTATFASAIANTIGVGDAIIYDCSANSALGAGDCIAFISGRTSSTVFTLKNKVGEPPTAYGAAAFWNIYRAYTELRYAEIGTENSAIVAIDATLGNFDSWTTARDIVTPKEQWDIALYDDAIEVIDTAPEAPDFGGWTTDATHYRRIYTPVSTSLVGTTQRHDGTWDTTGYKVQIDAERKLTISEDYFRLEGVQFEGTVSAGYASQTLEISSASYVRVAYNLFKDNSSHVGTTGPAPRAITEASGSGEVGIEIFNNIIIGYDRDNAGTPEGYGFNFSFISGNIYNNTIIGNTHSGSIVGISDTNSSGALVLKNNIVQAATTSYELGGGETWGAGTDSNLSNTVAATGGVNDVVSAKVNFIASGLNDYRLSNDDIFAFTQGEDLSGSFSDDISGTTRSATWDIGASTSLYPVMTSTTATNTCVRNLAGTVKCWGGAYTATPTLITNISSVITLLNGGGAFLASHSANGSSNFWGDGNTTASGYMAAGSGSVSSSGSGYNCSGAASRMVLLFDNGKAKSGGFTTITDGGTDITNIVSQSILAYDYVGNGATNYYVISDGSVKSGTGITASTFAALSNVRKIASGIFNSCAVLKTGGVKCWGSNAVGQIGDGTTTSRLGTPTDVSGISTAIDVAVENGDENVDDCYGATEDVASCAVLADGSVSCWGQNYGLTPSAVAGLSGIVRIEAGRVGRFTAVKNDNTIWEWVTGGVPAQKAGL